MTKSLILAIEPDAQQAAQLRTVADRLSAELLLVQSADRALATLNQRVPDLILTPALLSRRDEQALTDRLRELGEVTAHIQTVTIPILETAESKRGGVLSALRRDKPRASQGGCDAEVFAEQVSIYLQQAAGARRTSAPPAAVFEAPATPAPSSAARPEPPVSPATRPEPPVIPAARPEPSVLRAAPPEPPVSPAARPEPPVLAGPLEPPVSPGVRPEQSVLLAAPPEPPVPQARRPEPAVPRAVRRPVLAELPPVLEPLSLPEDMTAAAVSSVLHALAVPDNATVVIPANLLAQWRDSVDAPVHHAASDEGAPTDASADAVSAGVVSTTAPSPAVSVDVAADDLTAEDLSADDLSARDVSADDLSAEDVPADGVSVVVNVNDWRFFDPEQSRFAALLAKLDELAAAGA